MARAILRTFRDVRVGQVGQVGLELAPAGVLLVIAFGDPYGVGLGDDPLVAAPHGFVVGSQSRHGRSGLIGTAEGVQVDLPWSLAAAVFGPEVKDLADRAVAFPELSGGAELTDRLPETVVTDRQRLVAGWLRARTESHDAPPPLAVRALRRIEEGAPSVGALADGARVQPGSPSPRRTELDGPVPHDPDARQPAAPPRRARRDGSGRTDPWPTRRRCWATPTTRTCVTRPGSSPAGRRPSSSDATSTPRRGPGDLTTSHRGRDRPRVGSMTDATETLRAARHVVVQDYPDRDIPDSLTRAGFTVTIYGGPDPADVVVSELVDGAIVHRQTGRRPDRRGSAVRLPAPGGDRRHPEPRRSAWACARSGASPTSVADRIRTPTRGGTGWRRRASAISTHPPSTTWRGC